MTLTVILVTASCTTPCQLPTSCLQRAVVITLVPLSIRNVLTGTCSTMRFTLGLHQAFAKMDGMCQEVDDIRNQLFPPEPETDDEDEREGNDLASMMLLSFSA